MDRVALEASSIGPDGGSLPEVTVSGVDEIRGVVRIGFYENPADFPKTENALEFSPAVEVTQLDEPIVVTVKDVPPGIYAVAVVWDLNDDGILNTSGPFKKPTEPYAFSNNARSVFGPPKFEECSFEVVEPGGRLHIVIPE